MSLTRALLKVSKYGGGEDFEEWSFELRNALNLSVIDGSNEAKELLGAIEFAQASLNEDTALKNEQQQVSANLYAILAVMTTGAAKGVVRQRDTTRCGVQTWRELTRRFGKSENCLGGYLGVLNHDWTKGLENSFRGFVMKIQELKLELPDEVIEALVIKGVEAAGDKELGRHLRIRASQSTVGSKYKELVKVIEGWINMSRVISGGDTEAMDISFVKGKGKSKGKGSASKGGKGGKSGKGKGKGKGSIGKGKTGTDVVCYCCGKTGHVRAECLHKDKQCNTCGKYGHLGAVCKEPKAHHVEADEDPEAHISNVHAQWIFTVNRVDCGDNKLLHSQQSKVKVIRFLLDSGADCHLLPVEYLKFTTASPDGRLVRLFDAQGNTIPNEGKRFLTGWYNRNTSLGIKVVVAKCTRPLLSESELMKKFHVTKNNENCTIRQKDNRKAGKVVFTRDERGRFVLDIRCETTDFH
jgi:hypothetical protein